MSEGADLRKLLTNFRETVISAHSPADLTSRKFCILRRGMIDHLVATQPRTVEEWRQGLPLHRSATPSPSIGGSMRRGSSIWCEGSRGWRRAGGWGSAGDPAESRVRSEHIYHIILISG